MDEKQKVLCTDPRVSTSKDKWLINRAEQQTIWIVKLSNGETVFQDDDRQGLAEPSAWTRLQAYCEINNLHIVDFTIRFRTNKISLPSNKDGYFFCKGALSQWGAQKTEKQYVVGYVEDGIVHITKYYVPALLYWSDETRLIEKCDPNCLIMVDS